MHRKGAKAEREEIKSRTATKRKEVIISPEYVRVNYIYSEHTRTNCMHFFKSKFNYIKIKVNIKSKYLTEDEECFLLAEWLNLKGYKFTHIPNETFTKFWSVKIKNRKLGVSKGFPDYAIIVNNKLIFIEMKRLKGGQVSEHQKEWIDALNLCDGVDVYVCKGFDEAKQIIENYKK